MAEIANKLTKQQTYTGGNPRLGELRPPRLHKKGSKLAHNTRSSEIGERRLNTGAFVAMRGHGIVDSNSGLVVPVQRELRRIELYTGGVDG